MGRCEFSPVSVCAQLDITLIAGLARSVPPKIGATGQFPAGRYNEQDQGEIAFAVGADKANAKVLIKFGTPVGWLGMGADEAERLGDLLKEKAKAIR